MAALQAEKDELELKLAVAKSDRAAAVANLQGEVASLQSRLSRANKAAKEAQEQARSAEARLAEVASSAEAAAGASRDEEAGLRQRLQAAEALAAQQAQQLEALHGKAALAEQVGAASLVAREDWEVAGAGLDSSAQSSWPLVPAHLALLLPLLLLHPRSVTKRSWRRSDKRTPRRWRFCGRSVMRRWK